MRPYLFFTLAFFLAFPSLFAQTLSGLVSNEEGDPLPYVRVIAESPSQQAVVLTDLQGRYRLVLQAGQYQITVQSLGYQQQQRQLALAADRRLDLVLEVDPLQMEEVQISGGKKDPAYGIMKSLISHKQDRLRQWEAYQCETYLKNTLQRDTSARRKDGNVKVSENAITLTFFGKKEKDSTQIQVDSLAADSANQEVDSLQSSRHNFSLLTDSMNQLLPPPLALTALVETQATIYFRAPNQYKTLVNAYRTHSQSKTQQASNLNRFNAEVMAKYHTESRNPYLFYQDVSDADFNFYQNLIQVPQLGDRPFISPLHGSLWQLTYRYRLDSSYLQNGKVHYLISFWPRNKEGPYFKGSLVVVDGYWAIASIACEIIPSTLAIHKKFALEHAYEKVIEGRWVLKKEQYTYEIKEGKEKILGTSLALHSEYQINPRLPKGFFRNELRRTDKEAFEKGESYWAAVRPGPPTGSELSFARRQDSIIAHRTSDAYLGGLDSAFNTLTWKDVLLEGISFRDRPRGMFYNFSPIIEQIQPFGVGGYRHQLGAYLRKTFRDFKTLHLRGNIDYGIRNQDVRGNVRIGVGYNPRKFERAYVLFGKNYTMVNSNETILAILGRGNWVDKTVIGVGHRKEWLNGLFMDARVEFADWSSVSELQTAEWEDFFNEINEPVPFDPYRQLLFNFNLRFIPFQKYQLEPLRKVNQGSKWPTFTLQYKKAVPGFLGSEMNFDYLAIGAQHRIKLATFGVARWSMRASRFLNSKRLQFADYEFIRGADFYLFSNPLNTFQLLEQSFRTDKAVLQAHYVHDFQGAIIDKIPLLKKTPLQLSGGGGVLMIEDGNFFHSELYAGLQLPFRIRLQRLKAGVYFVTSYSNTSRALASQIKFGLTFFDNRRREWGY